MAKFRTAWGLRAYVATQEKKLGVKDVANATGMSWQHVSSVIHGRVDSPKARKKISDFLGISDVDDDE